MSIRNFNEARNYLLQYPPKWALYIPQQYASFDRVDERGGSSHPNERKNYALPYRELSYYDVVIDGRDWLNRMERRFAQRGQRVPSQQVWLHYILPLYRAAVTGDCETAAPNSGSGYPFSDGNLFVLFSTAADLWARRSDWGRNLAFIQRDNSNAMAFICWVRTWTERNYYVRWLDHPDSFWDAILEVLCQRSGTDAPCCTENLRGFYIDGWNEWHRVVTGGTAMGSEYHTPIAESSLYTSVQAVEAWRQFYVQLKRILREHDAFKTERPPDYTPEICSNTYSAWGLETSFDPSAYTNPYIVPADGYITRTVYVNRDHWSWDWYTNQNRRTDSIMVEEWYWSLYGTQQITGDIYRSVVTGADNRDARILTALRHGLTVYLQVPHAVSRDDYEAKVVRIAQFWSKYRTEFPGRIFFSERNHREVPRYPNGNRIDFVPYNGDPTDRRAGYPQPVSRLLRWNYDANPEFRPIKLTLNHGESQ